MNKMILAMTENNVIGDKNDLIVKSMIDMQFFREMTTKHNVIMGRNTHLSLPNMSLPNRYNVVISSTLDSGPAQMYANSIRWALRELTLMNMGCAKPCTPCKSRCNKLSKLKIDNWIIGGKELYESSLRYVDEVYITHYDTWYESDTAIAMSEDFMETLEEDFTSNTVFILDDFDVTGVVKKYTRIKC
jgi:dihydrofolate reductase